MSYKLIRHGQVVSSNVYGFRSDAFQVLFRGIESINGSEKLNEAYGCDVDFSELGRAAFSVARRRGHRNRYTKL